MHGDKVEMAGLELRFADESKRGATQYMSVEAIPADGGARRTGAARATLASGGRLVSLVDGKEYAVPEKGLVIGRDAGCDVVVPRNEVSRRHAEVAPTDVGLRGARHELQRRVRERRARAGIAAARARRRHPRRRRGVPLLRRRA